MGVRILWFVALILLAVGRPGEAYAQGSDLIRDVTTVETKMLGLARAMPPSAYDWRPGKDARSTGEVFIHVAADNYYMPVLMGQPAPLETGIDAKGKHGTVEAFEKRQNIRR